MRYPFVFGITVPIVLLLAVAAWAQTKNQRSQREAPRDADPDPYITRERSSQMRFRIGLRINADRGAFHRATATVVNPIDWPEQKLELVDEQAPFGVQIETRNAGHTAQQIVMRIPGISPGTAIECTRTYDLTRWTQRVKPEARAQLVAVAAERARPLLLPSDGIECTHAEVRKFASEAIEDKDEVWDRVNALFHATRGRIKYTLGPFSGALAGLRTGQGDCEELSCLFIAACRASGVPARIVWGPEHTWTEFALADPDGKLVWIPADPSKERELGVINHFTPILQKGDRFSVPEMPAKPQRYLVPVCTGMGRTPRIEPIETVEPVSVEE
jgi:hypothetical protein